MQKTQVYNNLNEDKKFIFCTISCKKEANLRNKKKCLHFVYTYIAHESAENGQEILYYL